MAGKAGAPSAVESFIPLYSGGLCEAVKLIPAAALSLRMAWQIPGVGVNSVHSRARKPLAETWPAHSAANFSPRKRVSFPTTKEFRAEEGDCSLKWSQIACETVLTWENVNSSAITARQPEVPNLMAIVRGPMGKGAKTTTYRFNRVQEPNTMWLFRFQS